MRKQQNKDGRRTFTSAMSEKNRYRLRVQAAVENITISDMLNKILNQYFENLDKEKNHE